MDERVQLASRPELPGESDEQLTDRARSGDQSAFGELYRRHRKAAQSTAWCLLRSKTDADDVVSDAFTGVLSALRNGRGPRDNFRRYLLACVRNGCRRRRHRTVSLTDEWLDRFAPDEHQDRRGPVLEDPERYVEADTVARAFASLAPRWQHTLWLTEVEQRPTRELSERMNLSPNAAAALAHRARQAFAVAYLAEHVGAVAGTECIRSAPLLAGYVRGQLGSESTLEIERHLVRCTTCAKAAAELRDMNGSLRSLIPVAPAAAFAGAVATVTKATPTVSSVSGFSIGAASAGLSGGLLTKALVVVLLISPALSADGAATGVARVSHATMVREATPSPAAPAAEASPEEDHGSLVLGDTSPGPDQNVAAVVADAATSIEQPIVTPIADSFVERLDHAFAVIALGPTGGSLTLLRSFVPPLDGPLGQLVVDGRRGVGDLEAHSAVADSPPIVAVAAPGAAAGESADAAAAPSVSAPAVTVPTSQAPLLSLPAVAVPSIDVPILDVSPITSPIVSIPPLTPPSLTS